MIRLEIVKTLGIWKEPDLFELVRADLRREAVLRNAAIQALASAGCQEALPLIKEKLRDPEGKNRVKAVEALRMLGDFDDVFRMAEDKDRDVRVEVAKALAGRPNRELAEKYLADHEKVQQATLESIASWPIETAGLLFFQALKSGSPTVRTRATELLSRSFPDAKKYDIAADPSSQTVRHAELLRNFQKQFPAPDEVLDDGPDAVSAITSLADLRQSLDDWNRSASRAEVRSAMETIGSIADEIPVEERAAIIDALTAMILQGDAYLQTDAAATLHLLGDPTGREALNRLSFSPNSGVKLYVSKTLASLEDPVFTPILIRFLDEGGSVCQSALSGLPKLVGENIGLIETKETRSNDLSPTRKKVIRWKTWAETHH